MKRMTFLAIDGCLFSSINNLIDAFGIANLWHGALNGTDSSSLFTTEIVSIDGKKVRANGNVHIQANRKMTEAKTPDMIFIPAFSQLSHLSTQNMDTILSWIVTNHQSGVPITAICTGVFLLAETGLLDGRTATTNWQFARLFQRKYPNVQLKPERIMTEAKGIICTGAASAVFDMSLHLIRRFGGKTLAANCAKALLIDPNRQSQAPYMVFRSTKDHKDEKILKAQHWFEENYGRTGSIDAVAKQMGISPRHFKRRFRKATGVPPLVYLQNVRIEMAKQKLENTRKSVNEITYCIGYEDSSTFRKLFKRETGLSPAEYRKKFCWKGGL